MTLTISAPLDKRILQTYSDFYSFSLANSKVDKSNQQIDLLYSVLGERIKAARKLKKFNQTKFAKLIGISRPSLVNIEKGRQRAPLHVIYYIADLLDLIVIDLLPSKEEFEESDINRRIQQTIQDNSAGDLEMEKKLSEFVKSTKKSYG